METKRLPGKPGGVIYMKDVGDDRVDKIADRAFVEGRDTHVKSGDEYGEIEHVKTSERFQLPASLARAVDMLVKEGLKND